MGKMFLIVVKSHLKWFEVEMMPSITIEATIAKLRDMFARYGIPQQLVSDNGSQFTLEEFCKFMKAKESSAHLLLTLDPTAKQSVLFKRSSNFLRRRIAIRLCNLARFLFSYRTTPNSTTGQTPAELFLNHRLRTRLDLMRPELGRKVFDRQTDQKA